MSLIRQFILQDPDDNTRLAEFDALFKIPVVIDIPHHEIHDGHAYKCDHIQQDDYDLCFKVPSGTKRVHFILNWIAESKVEIKLYEGREWDASSGTINTTVIFNRNRNSNNKSQIQENTTGSWVADMAFILDPTNIGTGGNDAGTEIHHWETWSDKRQTTQSREVSEFILKNDEVYVINVNSNDGAKDIQILCDWYEHTDE